MSTNEVYSSTLPTVYDTQDDLHEYPFFHEDSHLATDNISLNIVNIGNAKPSPNLPRVNWRSNSGTNDWLTSSNWSSYAYPGEGIVDGDLSLYSDVTASAIPDSYNNCLFTVINGSLNQHPTILSGFTTIDILVDMEGSVKSYRVNNIGRLTIVSEIISKMWDLNVANTEHPNIIVEEGSVEVH